MIPTNNTHLRFNLPAVYKRVANQLQKNKESDDLAICKLSLAIIEKNTNGIFNREFNETIQRLEIDKAECEKRLVDFNGYFYQDERSSLKQAWDKMVSMVKAVLGITIETREALSEILNEDMKGSEEAVNNYLDLEKMRDRIQTRLNLTISILKTRPDGSSFEKDLSEQVERLEQRQRELNGHYYEDPQSLLDQAWRRYQTALHSNDSNAGNLLNIFDALNDERKCNDAQLFTLRQQISCIVPSTHQNIDTHTCEKIKEKIKKLEAIENKS